jgi:hypothetical protein
MRYDSDVKRRRASLVVFLLLLLVGGAITNVAVAWALAMAINIEQVESFPEQRYVTTKQGFLVTTRIWTRGAMRHESKWAASKTERKQVMIDARGWPALSMRSTICRHAWKKTASGWDDCEEILGGVALADWPNRSRHHAPYGHHRLLPLHPIWPGFAINTLCYAGILWAGWLLFAAPFALRRRRRIRRGLCPACAYPVGASNVCTECGTPHTMTPKEITA